MYVRNGTHYYGKILLGQKEVLSRYNNKKKKNQHRSTTWPIGVGEKKEVLRSTSLITRCILTLFSKKKNRREYLRMSWRNFDKTGNCPEDFKV